jgi:hypothetical protein
MKSPKITIVDVPPNRLFDAARIVQKVTCESPDKAIGQRNSTMYTNPPLFSENWSVWRSSENHWTIRFYETEPEGTPNADFQPST